LTLFTLAPSQRAQYPKCWADRGRGGGGRQQGRLAGPGLQGLGEEQRAAVEAAGVPVVPYELALDYSHHSVEQVLRVRRCPIGRRKCDRSRPGAS